MATATHLSFNALKDFPPSSNRNLQKSSLKSSPHLLLLPSIRSSPFCSSKPSNSNIAVAVASKGAAIPRAVKQEEIQSSVVNTQIAESAPPSSKLVLVVGGTGGVGQLVVASLLSRNIKSRLLLRDPEKATTLFGEHDENTLKGVTHVICCTGTTAFPSKRWDGDNTPERVDMW
ncbi:hypothetical protein ACLOJK_000427 [Asimina triloba]